jgi:hypothetical protein
MRRFSWFVTARKTLILTGMALAAWSSAVLAQGTLAIRLSGPLGDRSTLVYSADAGWRMHAGWSAEDRAGPARSLVAAAGTSGMVVEGRPGLEQPSTVFVDGPTGYTFIHVPEEGWKFVGRVAETSR